jgi:alpha,alpha-trehalose phosphorylase
MVGNGHFGIRGSDEERRHSVYRGTFMNGFFEKKPIQYGEWAYGYARNHQTILNVVDAASIELEVDGSPLDFAAGLKSYKRCLDLDAGKLERRLEWESPSGVHIRVNSERLASFEKAEIAAMRYEASPETACSLKLVSLLDGSVRNRPAEAGDPRVGSHIDPNPIAWRTVEARDGALLLAGTTVRSGLGLAVAVWHAVSFSRSSILRGEQSASGEILFSLYSADCAGSERLRLDKFVAVVNGKADALEQLADEARAAAENAANHGFEEIVSLQADYLRTFWTGADILIQGDPTMEEGLRFNLFHLLQSAGRDGRTSIAAKGLSGEGYEGHYFWDTEIYALPFFDYEAPAIARSLVRYRIGILEKARERARELSLPGALFPWRTIDGEETSAYYPAGTAQFHIDADIAYALVRYSEATGDRSIMLEGGAELLFETARLWMGLGFFNLRKDGKFCILCVTGPDEYTALVDNNAYTNLMAEFNLRYAWKTAIELQDQHPEVFKALAERIGLSPSEIDEWRRAADSMYIPFDKETGVVPQDDQFMDRPVWNLAETPREQFPLLLHYHPLMIYRRQVLKQPDTVLAMFLRHERFSLAEKMRNFRFYEPLTTGDSSLSHCIQSVAAAECGETGKAYEYFAKTARMDLDDVHGNSRDGVHIAAMAGSWISVVYGFAGMREDKDCLSFSPKLPPVWKRLAFSIAWRGSRIRCDYTAETSTYSLVCGTEIDIEHEGKRYHLASGAPVCIDERPKPLAWIFDLDGVIADTALLHTCAWRRLADELGILFKPETGELVKGVSRMASLRIVLGSHVAEYKAESLAELADRKNRYYRELVEHVGSGDILPGMANLLASLKNDGCMLVLASASRNAPVIIERLGLKGTFDRIVDAAAVCMPKPDPEIFIKAAEMAGARLKDCVAFEDAQAGIDAIRAAGIFSVGIGAKLVGADIRFNSTLQVDRKAIEDAFFKRGTTCG